MDGGANANVQMDGGANANVQMDGGANANDDQEFDPFSDKFSDELCEELLQYQTFKCERCGVSFEFRGNEFDPERKNLLCGACVHISDKCKCQDCGLSMQRGEGFPQSSVEWNTNNSTSLRCGQCWEKHIRENMLPQMSKEDIKKNRSKKSKSKSQTKCKKCGGTNHKTARSRWCPHNPKYNKFKGNYFGFPLPDIPGEGVGGYFNPLTAPPPSITSGQKDTSGQKVIRRPVTPPPAASKKAPPPVLKSKKAPPPVLKSAPVVDDKDVHSVEIPFTGAPPKKKLQRKKALFGSVRCYTVGSNVLAMFKKNKWFLAQVTARKGVKHDVYFPDDSQTLKGLTPDRLRPLPASSCVPTRREMIGKEFEYEGDDDIPAGTVWKVRRVNKGNVFQCTKIRGGGRINIDDFDIGYVMQQYQYQQEQIRERGPRGTSWSASC